MTFGAETTTTDVLQGIDLTGKVALVTGASSGLGAETARSLASVGAAVTLAVRDTAKGSAVAEKIASGLPDAELAVARLDLASLASVRTFAGEWLADHRRLDILVNNAGVMAPPLGRTSDGFELQLGTNHLGHFLLTGLLAPELRRGAPARVVNLSSRGHLRSDIEWDDPHYRTRPYDKWEAYGQSKTANILFTVELDRRLRDAGVRAYAVHPGVIFTELSRHLDQADLTELMARSPSGMTLRPVEAGAATSVWAATSPELSDIGGVYLEDCHISTRVATPDDTGGHAPWALDPDSAARLWTWSEGQVGQSLPVD